MSFGSDSPGGANEGVGGSSFGGSGGGGLGIDYGFTGMGTTPGLRLGPTDNIGTDYGFSAPAGYDIGGGVGGGLAGNFGAAGYGDPAANYSLDSLYSMNQYGNAARAPDALGASAYASPAMGLSLAAANANPWGYQPEPGFWGSRMQKALSFFAGFNPVTALGNTIANVAMSPDPLKGLVQGVIGSQPYGNLANAAYGAATSPNPAGYAATQGAGYVGGMVGASLGNEIGGPAGAQLGAYLGSKAVGGLVGGEVGRTNAQAAGYGPFGSGSPAEAGFASGAAGLANGPGPSASAGRAAGGTERNWTDTLMSIGSGIYGMRQADAQRQLSQQAVGGSAPWTASGGNAVAGEQLKAILAGDFTKDAGFKAAQRSAARASSQQPGGMAATAAAQAALKYQNDRIQALGAPAGVGFSPAAGYQTAVQGVTSANDLASKSLGSIGFGVNGGNTGMPPWLQTWLIQNGMGGPKGG